MRVCIGGTFDSLHNGHKRLIEKAFDIGSEVTIGLTSDRMARVGREGKIKSFEVRKKNLDCYIRKVVGAAGRAHNYDYEIVRIDDRFGPAASGRFDAIIVSPETRFVAEQINAIRTTNGLNPMSIYEITLVLAEDGTPIKGKRIRNGEMTPDGSLLRTLTVSVGSSNKVKVDATRNIFSKLYKRVIIRPTKFKSPVPEQPFEKDVLSGAILRAKRAIEDTKTDFGVGIEAGLFWNKEVGNYYDVQYCAIIDKMGHITIGHGPGFQYPREVISLVKDGRTVSEAFEELYGITDIGSTIGAVGYLSDKMIDRTKLTEQAIIMAMIPRVKRELY